MMQKDTPELIEFLKECKTMVKEVIYIFFYFFIYYH